MRARMRAAPFARWMGIELVSLEDGAGAMRMHLEPHHLNPGGIAHGGVIAALLDSAIGLALRTKLGMDATHVTLELHVNYLKPARGGTMVARSTAVHSGSRVGYGEAALYDEGEQVLAKGSATYLIVPGAGAPPGSDA